MATCRDVIRAALRKLGVVKSGKEPSASQANDGLEELTSLLEWLVVEGKLGRLTDVLISTSPYTAKAGQRIAYSGAGDLTYTLPATEEYLDHEDVPEDGDQEHRKPLELSPIVVESADGATTYIYDGGQWVDVSSLGLSDEAPLSQRYRRWLVAELAMRLADDYGMTAPPGCVLDATLGRSALSLKLSAASRPASVSYF
jgi:hypothetical protein